MSTRDEMFRAELAHILLRHGGSQQIETAVIRLHRDDLAAADSRVADLEAGIRRLCDEIDDDSPWWVRGVGCVPIAYLRALVGDETPGTGDGA